MNSEKPTHENNPKDYTDATANKDSQATPQLPPSIRISKSDIPPSPHSYEITCKTEKDWRDKVKFWAEIVVGFFIILYTIVTILLFSTAKDQLIALYNSERPRIFVKMPNKIHMEASKPIEPTVEFFNYGKIPGMVRARVRFEVGQGVIEKFRDGLLHHADDFLLAPQNDKKNLNIMIASNESAPYPIETPPVVLAQKDIDNLASGSVDIAVYGRIFYSDLSVRASNRSYAAYTASFCFYFRRDGTASACPNEEHAYTNFAP